MARAADLKVDPILTLERDLLVVETPRKVDVAIGCDELLRRETGVSVLYVWADHPRPPSSNVWEIKA
jgi:hypothetical protein